MSKAKPEIIRVVRSILTESVKRREAIGLSHSFDPKTVDHEDALNLTPRHIKSLAKAMGSHWGVPFEVRVHQLRPYPYVLRRLPFHRRMKHTRGLSLSVSSNDLQLFRRVCTSAEKLTLNDLAWVAGLADGLSKAPKA